MEEKEEYTGFKKWVLKHRVAIDLGLTAGVATATFVLGAGVANLIWKNQANKNTYNEGFRHGQYDRMLADYIVDRVSDRIFEDKAVVDDIRNMIAENA